MKRIGIDVGGTSTKAVAIDTIDKKIVGKKLVPITHSMAGGVSNGIVQALLLLCCINSIHICFRLV